MRNAHFLNLSIIVAIAVASVSGCGGPKQMTFGKHKDEPDWIDDAPKGHYVGTSDPGLLRSTARSMALDRGRQILAQKFSAQIRGAIEDAAIKNTQTSGGYVEQSEEKPWQAGSTTMFKVGKDVLSGADARKYWTNPEDGTTYALVYVDREFAKQSIKDAMTEARLQREYGKELLDDIIEDTNKNIDQYFEE
jgi:hypothetical protein